MAKLRVSAANEQVCHRKIISLYTPSGKRMRTMYVAHAEGSMVCMSSVPHNAYVFSCCFSSQGDCFGTPTAQCQRLCLAMTLACWCVYMASADGGWSFFRG